MTNSTPETAGQAATPGQAAWMKSIDIWGPSYSATWEGLEPFEREHWEAIAQAAIAAAAPAPAADDAEKATRKRNCPGESACRARGTYRMSGICCQAGWYEREEADSALVLADGEVIATHAYSGGAIRGGSATRWRSGPACG